MIGYARVSTVHQDTALQLAAFEAAGVRDVREEKRSGSGVRPVLDQLLIDIKSGQVLVVYKVDRLARSLADLLRILERLAKRGAGFRSLTEPLETQTPAGRMMVQMLGAVAEFERAVIRERCEAGRIAARERGVQFGRPRYITEEVLRDLVARGITQAEAARLIGCSRHALLRARKRYGLAFHVDGRSASPSGGYVPFPKP
jgi:DNA invertase Pin-like site-specific DNA recombinase